MKIKFFAIILATSLFALFTACENDNDEIGEGRVVVKLTDAPFPSDLVAEANVTISRVEIRKTGDNEGSPFIVLMEEKAYVNLLDLTNGIVETLADIAVPAGEYDLVRLYVDDADVLLSDDRSFDLMVPSGAQTGIKVFIEPALRVTGGVTSELLLDFDVSRSFVVQGNANTPAGINGFIFKPVIKATDLSHAGRLTGTVYDADGAGIEGAQVSVFIADTLNTTTFTGEAGGYAVLGLEAALYDVSVKYNGYDEVFAEDVEIVAGNATILDFELSEQETEDDD